LKNADYWIHYLGLKEHPEGGYFRETYRSDEYISRNSLPERFGGNSRSFSTSIYFLLRGDQISHLHRIQSDEIWHFYQGSPLRLHIIDEDGKYSAIHLGNNPDNGESFQAIVKKRCWFGATVDILDSYSLVGCTVAPGFDFQDFEMGKRDILVAKYPKYKEVIERLTKYIRP